MTEQSANYLSSLTSELHHQADRVRNLIGSRHWGIDGRHKEALLIGFLKKFLPGDLEVGTGFAFSTEPMNTITREQDILIVDTSNEAPLFNENGLLICPIENVVASISVKSTLGHAEVDDVVDGLRSVKETALAARVPVNKVPWCAGFFFRSGDSFSSSPELAANCFGSAVASRPLCPPRENETCDVSEYGLNFAVSLPGQIWYLDYAESYQDQGVSKFGQIRSFHSDQQAAAVFVSELLSRLAAIRGKPRPHFKKIVTDSFLNPCGDPVPIQR